ncbi:MAG: hypothetical protein ABW094_11475 [Candidatus Thiodiazotropha sp.]
MKQKEFEKLIHSDEVAGRVIRFCTTFENRLDDLIARHFTTNDRIFDFYELIISRLSLYEKIQILKNMSFHRKMKSQDNIVASMDSIRKLRNALAHHSYMPEREIKKLYSDQNIRKLLSDYPKGLSKEKNALENRFSRLWHSYYVQFNKSHNNDLNTDATENSGNS